jgi:hypothetical protein
VLPLPSGRQIFHDVWNIRGSEGGCFVLYLYQAQSLLSSNHKHFNDYCWRVLVAPPQEAAGCCLGFITLDTLFRRFAERTSEQHIRRLDAPIL